MRVVNWLIVLASFSPGFARADSQGDCIGIDPAYDVACKYIPNGSCQLSPTCRWVQSNQSGFGVCAARTPGTAGECGAYSNQSTCVNDYNCIWNQN